MDVEIKFSIIMAAYNAEKYIKEAINSVLCQTYQNWELIIVDDGSTDKTVSITDLYARKDKRIIVIHQENSGTAAAARNTALEYVTGQYMQMLDSDDKFEKTLLESYFNILQQNSAEIIIPDCICYDENGVVWKKKAPGQDYNQVIGGMEAFGLSLDWTIHGFFCVKSELIQYIKYDPGLINGDEFTTRKLLYNAKKILFSKRHYFYRKNTDSTTRSKKNAARMFECLVTDKKIYCYALENKMPDNIKIKCADKLVASLIWHFMDYEKLKCQYSYKERKFIQDIIQSIYSFIGPDLLHRCPIKYKIIYYCGGRTYKGFERNICLINKIRLLIKR